MRETPKPLTAALITVCLLFGTLLAGSAGAHVAGRAHHLARHHRHLGKHHGRTHRRHAKPTGEHASKTREAAKLDATKAAATIASVLATPCQNTEVTPEASNAAAVREAVLCLVNRVRAEHSLAPLKTSPELQAAAEDHNAEMLQLDYFAHVAPDGETPVQRIEKTGYVSNPADGYVIGENLAWGTYSLSTPKSIVAAWVASPGHLANILESRYTETGVGVVSTVPESLGEGSPGATYAQEFGVVIR